MVTLFKNTITLTDEEYHLFNELLEARFGLFFPEQRRNNLESRLCTRLAELHLDRFMDYYLLLQSNTSDEMGRLATVITNNETYFFREKYQFEALFGEALQLLASDRNQGGRLEVLSAACSSGEEALTINFYAKDRQFLAGGIELSVDAFDVDEERVGMARRMAYRPRSLRAMDEYQISRYLDLCEPDLYEVKPRYRTGVRFERGNIIDVSTYPTRGPYDVVFCRNALIYFSDLALRQAIENFAKVLRPGGLLMLGHSESIIGMSRNFETVRLADCVLYRRVLS